MSTLPPRRRPAAGTLFATDVPAAPPADPAPVPEAASSADAPPEEPAAIDLRTAAPRKSKSPAAKRGAGQRPLESQARLPSTVIQLTLEQWAWVDSVAKETGQPKWHVVLGASEANVDELREYFRRLIPEGGSVFRLKAAPKDVVGEKRQRSLRLPPVEREILDRLVEECEAPSMSMYLRIAVHMAMGRPEGQR